MSKSKCQKAIEGLRYAEGCILYFERMSKLPDCNTCGKKLACKYCPDYGEPVRVNCFAWEKEKNVRKNSKADNEKDGV